MNDRTNRNFGLSYSNGSSYVPARKWHNPYQSTRPEPNALGYVKRSHPKGKPTTSLSQGSPYTVSDADLNTKLRQQARTSQPQSPAKSKSADSSAVSHVQFQQRPPQARNHYKPDAYVGANFPTDTTSKLNTNPTFSRASCSNRLSSNGTHDTPSSSTPSSSSSKAHVPAKDKADLFAHKWNVSYPTDPRGHERGFTYEDESYCDRNDFGHKRPGELRGLHHQIERVKEEESQYNKNTVVENKSQKIEVHEQERAAKFDSEESSPLDLEKNFHDDEAETGNDGSLSRPELGPSNDITTIAIEGKDIRNSRETNDVSDPSPPLNEKSHFVKSEKEAINGTIPLSLEIRDKLDHTSKPITSSIIPSIPEDIKTLEVSQVIESETLRLPTDEENHVDELDNKALTDDDHSVLEIDHNQNVEADSSLIHESIPQVSEKKKTSEYKSQTTSPLEVDSCIFPLSKLEDENWKLKNHSREQVLKTLPHLLRKPVKNLKEYQFFDNNELIHTQTIKPKLLNSLSLIKSELFFKKFALIKKYKDLSSAYSTRQGIIDNQLDQLYPKRNEVGATGPSPNSTLQYTDEPYDSKKPQNSSRRSRHGDTVRSEAEFLEILKNLEEEKEKDPLYRAEQVAAVIPDMILDPLESQLHFQNANNLITDKKQWASRINTDGLDNFTRKEHELFCEAFLQYPKRFGKISNLMGGLRTAEDCVLHYYKTKKTLTDYKQMVLMKKKKTRKGSVKPKRGSKHKTPTTSNPTTPASTVTPIDSETEKEFNLDKFIPQEAILSEEVFTETGRRRRAAAPVFDSQEKNGNSPQDTDRKRSLENSDIDLQKSESTKPLEERKQAKKKQKVQKSKTKVPEIHEDPAVSNEAIKETNISSNTDILHPNQLVDSTLVDSTLVEEGSSETDTAKLTKPHISSYWSVKDSHLFVKLLAEYGTNWNLLADKLRTKTAIMVRNYYQRNTDSLELQKAAANAASLISRGLLNTEAESTASPLGSDQPKNPPLGVFTAHNSVPSNINFDGSSQNLFQSENLVPSSQEHSLPSISNTFVSNSGPLTLPSMRIPGYASDDSMAFSKAETGVSSMPSLSNLLTHPLTSNTDATDAMRSVTSNPFSITSLLNPSEDSNGSNHSISPSEANYQNIRTEMSHGHSSISSYNPLDTLVAATEKKDAQSLAANNTSPAVGLPLQSIIHQSDSQHQFPLPRISPPVTTLPSVARTNPMRIINALGEVKGLYDRDQTYAGSYSTLYPFEVSERSASLLNPKTFSNSNERDSLNQS